MHINPSRGIWSRHLSLKAYHWLKWPMRSFATQVESEHRYLGSQHKPFQLIHASQLYTWFQRYCPIKPVTAMSEISLALGLRANDWVWNGSPNWKLEVCPGDGFTGMFINQTIAQCRIGLLAKLSFCLVYYCQLCQSVQYGVYTEWVYWDSVVH